MKGEDFGELQGAGSNGQFFTNSVGDQSTTNVTFPIIDDDVYEGGSSGTPETFILRVAGRNSTTNHRFSYDVTMRIVDNDPAPPTITASFDVSSVDETVGRVEFLLTFDGTAPGTQVQYEINTVDGSATAGQDYVAVNQDNLSATLSTGLPSVDGAYFITIADDQDVEAPKPSPSG